MWYCVVLSYVDEKSSGLQNTEMVPKSVETGGTAELIGLNEGASLQTSYKFL